MFSPDFRFNRLYNDWFNDETGITILDEDMPEELKTWEPFPRVH